MLFMVIERYRDRDTREVYRRLQQRGRMLPVGLEYVGSWVEADLDRCFQLVECDDARTLQQWVIQWQDLVEFEITPVVPSEETAEAIARML